ncbi:alpha/beta hydrolase [Glutamicibacter sp. AOP33-2CA-4]|uniref:alpha/beta hydrolase n=1 Tax=Glutamicibacter sp. AOP33-2CA-4 TaxID=3457690 RepID=UPI004034AA95
MTARNSLLRFASLGAALSLALVSCAGSGPSDTEAAPSATNSQPAAAPEAQGELAKYYDQDVTWEPCGSTVECATIQVPLDYENPGQEDIDLALNRRASEGAKRNLLVNPGGPGGSGLGMVTDSVPHIFSNDLQREFNTIGFDPRGVGKSSPVKCQTDEQTDLSRQQNLRAWVPEDREEIIKQTREYSKECAQNTGDLLGHVDTVSAAKDLDIIRAVLGDEKLDYLGFSYGTFLGATYAELFPQRVGGFVLDGAMDPAVSSAEVNRAQAVGFEREIDAWLESCLKSEACPFDGTLEEAKVQLQLFFAQIENEPLVSSDGRTVPIIDFINGFIVPLYDNSSWPILATAMREAMEGDVDQVLLFADLASDRSQDGTYTSNSSDAFVAINCLNRPMDADPATMQTEAEELMRVAPTLGKYLSYGAITCNEWEHDATGLPAELQAQGSGEILVVGTTGDPATPYEWSQSLASQLSSATLLTFEGHGHTAYGRSNDCVTEAVDAYLIEGKAPEDDTVC